MPRTNWNNTRHQFQMELTRCAAGVNKAAEQIYSSATKDFLTHIQERKAYLPYYTGNLHDSIAAYVSRSGRIIRAHYMPKEATKPQHVTTLSSPDKDSPSYENSSVSRSKAIWGYREAINAVRRSRPQATGIGATLFVAVPYAGAADQYSHNPGYIGFLEENFKISMEAAMRILSMYSGDPRGAKKAFMNYIELTHIRVKE